MQKSGASKDPVQQKLRDHKKNYNKISREFISRMIAFKQFMNGRGNSEYGLPPSDIKNPLPSEINSFLNDLSRAFQLLASEAVKIQKEQEEYSKNRKKSNKELGIKAKVHFNKMIKTASAGDIEVQLGNYRFKTLLAVSAEEQEKGLMFMETPPVMSFVYSSPVYNSFWMKNTPADLDIVFTLNGKITTIKKGESNSLDMISGNGGHDLVIELPYGTCDMLNIKAGDIAFIDRSEPKLADKLAKKYYNLF